MMEYEDRAIKTFKPSTDPIIDQLRLVLGLVGEAGEVAEKFKKFLRQDYGEEKLLEELPKELGDVLWYISILANNSGFSLQDVAEQNLKKLEDRDKRGVIKGSGDSR